MYRHGEPNPDSHTTNMRVRIRLPMSVPLWLMLIWSKCNKSSHGKGWFPESLQTSHKSKSGQIKHLYLFPSIGFIPQPSQITPQWIQSKTKNEIFGYDFYSLCTFSGISKTQIFNFIHYRIDKWRNMIQKLSSSVIIHFFKEFENLLLTRK